MRGEVRSSWEQVSGGLKLDVTVPPNATGRVYLPGTDPSKVGEVGSGTPLVAGRAPGVTLVGVQDDSVVYRVGSGSYAFRVGPGVFASTDATGTVGGTVPATLSLTVGTASFGAFTPGADREYTATTTANVISTAGDADAQRERSRAPDQRRVRAARAAAGRALQGELDAPVSNDPVTITFRQHIGATDPLRTGAYSRTLTFTLSTTTP